MACNSKPTDIWSQAEIEAALVAYLELLAMERNGQAFSPTEVHRRLATTELARRSEGSIARRMSNISSVLSENGHRWVQRYNPSLDHVGTRVANMILRSLSELQSTAPIDSFDGVALIERANVLLERGDLKLPAGSAAPQTRTQTTTVYVRSAEVVAWVLREASGQCEACNRPAPFSLPSGRLYLEVHHVLRLADRGPDVVENAIALCPNCHRRLHHSVDADSYRSEIIAANKRLKDFRKREG